MVTVPKVVATKKRFLLWFCCVWFQCAILLWKKESLRNPKSLSQVPMDPFFWGETIHFKTLSAMKIQEALDGFSCLDVLCVDP